MTEASAYILLKKDFIKKVIEITLSNINDQMFCQDSSTLICDAFKSDRFISEHSLFVYGIGRFKLALTLLTKYKSNDAICLNSLYIINKILLNSKLWKVQEEDFKMLFNSNIFETTSFIMNNTRNESVIQKFNEMCAIMDNQSKNFGSIC